jgi:homoserine O-succinyltransferase
MATSPDGLRTVCWQGHPEYEDPSLLVEYNRDLRVWHEGGLSAKPTIPKHYFRGAGAQLAQRFHDSAVQGQPFPEIPRKELAEYIENRWDPVRGTLMGNWVSAVFEKTDFDRHKPFMHGVDPLHVFNGGNTPEDPLELAV